MMKVQEVMLEPTPFEEFIQKFRKEKLYDQDISKEVLVRDWNYDDPLATHFIYVSGNRVAVVYIPEDTKSKIRSYHLVENVPQKNGEIDYVSAYQLVMGKTGHGIISKVIIVRKGEKNPLLAIHSGLGFHESPFKDSP
jgi:hypothetical protein